MHKCIYIYVCIYIIHRATLQLQLQSLLAKFIGSISYVSTNINLVEDIYQSNKDKFKVTLSWKHAKNGKNAFMSKNVHKS